MKKLIYLFLLVGLLACSSNDPKVFKLDSNAMVSIKPAVGAWNSNYARVKSDIAHLSALEIVEQATNLSAYNIPLSGNQAIGWGFAESQRDTITPALKMWGTGIISQNGDYVPDFIEANDCVIQRVISDYPNPMMDTIAYLPNSVLRAAEIQIKAAFASKDNATVYQIFNTAFTFTPITGSEWRALKANNQE